MSGFQQLKEMLKRFGQSFQFSKFVQTPISKIVAINTALFLAWKVKGVSQTFLVKHFSFERFNMKNYRIYTMLTYAFSHYTFFSYLFDMLTLFFLGKGISMRCGSKYIWLLYLGGAISGSIFMNIFMPHNSIVMPQVGADSAIAALITFYGMFNLQQHILLFFFPVKVWILLSIMGVYSLMADPSKKNLGGMIYGALMYRLFKMKVV